MADPVKQQGTVPAKEAVKPKPPAPKAPVPKAKAAAPEVKPEPKAKQAVPQGTSAPKVKQASVPKGAGVSPVSKKRMVTLDVNLGRTGRRMESALPIVKPKPKPVAKPKPAAPKAEGCSSVSKKHGSCCERWSSWCERWSSCCERSGSSSQGAPKPGAKPVAKRKAPRPKKHYFILENLCVGCGLCLDKCPPKVNAIGYKFYGDVQENGFRCYIDQDACISCSACFSSDECPTGALIEILPDGEILDFTYTPPERLDFDLRFLHRFHKENR
ncbi:4Fe-4S dicluster domain-containing protein [Prosthecochloris sp. SCSIO W1101]|uniref:4Fe-4S dicluster domain-containing protein n=1 Tax=Prosthecochloris sp. SCSIO W1101 TaxID=2992242 RepID=UPI00223D3114|nr:4Fe-4S dicluster domain-containing protein [Prosthecochloris sp. SCSIO W1101]UZJ41209.1 4Fe-4S dicluster domain-containing protein [Prosthecochloris sp. SCSIO W1101]